jgi:hypothetical protein
MRFGGILWGRRPPEASSRSVLPAGGGPVLIQQAAAARGNGFGAQLHYWFEVIGGQRPGGMEKRGLLAALQAEGLRRGEEVVFADEMRLGLLGQVRRVWGRRGEKLRRRVAQVRRRPGEGGGGRAGRRQNLSPFRRFLIANSITQERFFLG